MSKSGARLSNMADTMETTQAPASDDLRGKIEAQLATCRDPEIGLDIMSLGLVYEVGIDEGNVLIKMTLTAIGCPWAQGDRKSTRLNSSHLGISYAVFCLKKKKKTRVSIA